MLGYLNDRLTRAYTRGGTFVTAFYAVLDPATRTLTYARAGHNPPRLVRGKQVLSLNGLGGLPLGILTAQAYQQATVTMAPDNLLLLYTDGITEAMSPVKGPDPRQLFGIDRLDKLLLDSGTGTADDCISRIRTAVTAFTENSAPSDDQTLIAIRCV